MYISKPRYIQLTMTQALLQFSGIYMLIPWRKKKTSWILKMKIFISVSVKNVMFYTVWHRSSPNLQHIHRLHKFTEASMDIYIFFFRINCLKISQISLIVRISMKVKWSKQTFENLSIGKKRSALNPQWEYIIKIFELTR